MIKNLIKLSLLCVFSLLIVVNQAFIKGAIAQSAAKIDVVRGDVVFPNSYIVEGESGVVVIDSLLTRDGGSKVRKRVDATGKELLAVIVTHGHPDHYGGITTLVDGLGDVPIVALQGVDDVIRRDDASKGERLAKFEIDWPEQRTFPNTIVESNQVLKYGDLELTPITVGENESDHDTIWILRQPNAKVAFVGDLIMEGMHAYTADAHTGEWLATLDSLESQLEDVNRIYPGHGESGGLELLKPQKDYLTEFRTQVREIANCQPSMSEAQAKKLQSRMVNYLGTDKNARWILESANPVAEELAENCQN